MQSVTAILVRAAMQTLDKVDRPSAKPIIMAQLQTWFPGVKPQLLDAAVEAAVAEAKVGLQPYSVLAAAVDVRPAGPTLHRVEDSLDQAEQRAVEEMHPPPCPPVPDTYHVSPITEA